MEQSGRHYPSLVASPKLNTGFIFRHFS